MKMNFCHVNYFNLSKKGQMKIQQMAFMLVAIVIFFSMVALIYFSISMNNLRHKYIELKDSEARELVRKLSGAPELTFTADSSCSGCVDFDKAFVLSQRFGGTYSQLVNLEYLSIEKIYPSSNDPCNAGNYPNCEELVLIDKADDSIATKTAFVALAWRENNNFVFGLGRIHASAKTNE